MADLIDVGRRRGRDSGLQTRAREKLVEVEARIADLETIRTNLVAALDAGCDDVHQCATSDCCPLPPFVEITTRGDAISAKIKDRHLYGAGAAACAVCCAPILALLGIAGAGLGATVATVAFAGVAFGLVVLAATLLGVWCEVAGPAPPPAPAPTTVQWR